MKFNKLTHESTSFYVVDHNIQVSTNLTSAQLGLELHCEFKNMINMLLVLKKAIHVVGIISLTSTTKR